MGGEPLHKDNLFLTNLIITEVRKVYPDIKIYLWTGYTYETLLEKHVFSIHQQFAENMYRSFINPLICSCKFILFFGL